MKKHLLFFIVFLNTFVTTQAHQSDFTEHCDAICLPYLGSLHRWKAVTSTDSALYLVGNSGVCFIYTYKGGVKTIYTGTTADLTGVQFINDTVGFVWGTNGTLLKTTDAGNNWNVIATNTTDSISKVQFIDANNGYMIANAVISKTNNGGILWTPLTLPVTITFKDFHFFDLQNGQICGLKTIPSLSGYLYTTTDGGSSWSQLYADTCAFTKLNYTNGSNGYLYGTTSTNPLLLETNNTGNSWTIKYSSTSWSLASDVVMYNDQTTFIANETTASYVYGLPYFLDPITGMILNPINIYASTINNKKVLYLLTEAGLYRYFSGEFVCKQLNFTNGIKPNEDNPYNIMGTGKKVRFKALLYNVTSDTVLNAKGTITCSSPYVTITDSNAAFTNILNHQSSWSTDEYEIEVSPAIPSSHVIHLLFSFENKQFTDTIQYSVMDLPIITTPFSLTTVAVADTATENTSGNGNGTVEPFETAQVTPFIKNETVHYFYNIRGYLFSKFPQCAIWNNNAKPDGSGVVYNNYLYGSINPNDIAQPTGPYVFTDSFQTNYNIPFTLILTGQITTYKDQNNYSYTNYLNVLYNFGIDFTINNAYSLPPDSLLPFPPDTTITVSIGITNTSLSFTLFPNPTNGEFYLKTKSYTSTENIGVQIYNLLGERIYTQPVRQGSTFRIDISNQPQGLYFLIVTANGSTETIKFIKQ